MSLDHPACLRAAVEDTPARRAEIPAELDRVPGRGREAGGRPSTGDDAGSAIAVGGAIDTVPDLAQMILDNAGDAYVAIDGEGIVIGWNRAAARMYGYSQQEAIGRYMPDLIMPAEYRDDHDAGVERYKLAGHGVVAEQFVELEAVRKNGEIFPIEMAFWGIHRADGWQFYSFARDISERKAREEELYRRARYDDATGLKNRTALVESMTDIGDRLTAGSGRAAVILVEVERFTTIRDSLGHRVSEQIIATVAERLQRRFGDRAEVARIAESEFVIVDPHLFSMSAAMGRAGDIVEAFLKPVSLPGGAATISVIAGAMLFDGSVSPDVALRDVSAGLHDNRTVGAAAVAVDDAVLARVRRRTRIESELATAVDDEQLVAYYQPILHMATGRIVAAEALVRWQHPESGLLAPAAFIDIAEESGLIVSVGSWMLREAAAQLGRWLAAGFGRFQVGVNLSARQFAQADLLSEVDQARRTIGFDTLGGTLVLEVTETVMMNDPPGAAATLGRLKDMGIEVALDDFGTGYSSMAYLTTFPVDAIKIDRSFVYGIDANPRNQAIVRAITELGHALGLEVLAEGIETDGEREVLAGLGCDLAQGFLFGRPMPADELTALLEAQEWDERG